MTPVLDCAALVGAWLLICGGALLCAAHAPARGILPRGTLPLAIRRKEQDP